MRRSGIALTPGGTAWARDQPRCAPGNGPGQVRAQDGRLSRQDPVGEILHTHYADLTVGLQGVAGLTRIKRRLCG